MLSKKMKAMLVFAEGTTILDRWYCDYCVALCNIVQYCLMWIYDLWLFRPHSYDFKVHCFVGHHRGVYARNLPMDVEVTTCSGIKTKTLVKASDSLMENSALYHYYSKTKMYGHCDCIILIKVEGPLLSRVRPCPLLYIVIYAVYHGGSQIII